MRTPPDPRTLFEESIEAVKARCRELLRAIDRDDPACAGIVQRAVFTWLSAQSACRTLLSAGRSGAPDPHAGAARRLLASNARVLTELLVQATRLSLTPSACNRLKTLCSLLARAMNAPLVDADGAARDGEGDGSRRAK